MGKHCWFKHNENESNERNETKDFENSEVGQKIFDFMEKNDRNIEEFRTK